MYTDLTPLSLGSYKTTDGFDIYAQTEYPFESKQAQQDIALKMRMEHSPQTKFSIASFSLLCLTAVICHITCYFLEIISGQSYRLSTWHRIEVMKIILTMAIVFGALNIAQWIT